MNFVLELIIFLCNVGILDKSLVLKVNHYFQIVSPENEFPNQAVVTELYIFIFRTF